MNSSLKIRRVIHKIGFVFVVVIPLSLIAYSYVNHYISNRKVTFDSSISNMSTYVSSFTTLNELEHINLIFDWKTYAQPKESEDKALIDGYFTFEFTYEPINNSDVHQVTLTPVLQTEWVNVRSLGSTITLVPYMSSEGKIDFNYRLPLKPLYFITVNNPILYLKIDYTILNAGFNVPYTNYIRIDLSKYSPNQVIS